MIPSQIHLFREYQILQAVYTFPQLHTAGFSRALFLQAAAAALPCYLAISPCPASLCLQQSFASCQGCTASTTSKRLSSALLVVWRPLFSACLCCQGLSYHPMFKLFTVTTHAWPQASVHTASSSNKLTTSPGLGHWKVSLKRTGIWPAAYRQQ